LTTKKICTKCKKTKNITKFHTDRRARDNLTSACTTCRNKDSLTYRDEHLEIRRAAERKYYAANKEQKLARVREYYHNNKEKEAKRKRIWRQNNPHKDAAAGKRYNARSYLATPPWAEEQLELVKTIYLMRNYLNELWGTNFVVDHVVPLHNDVVCGLNCWDNMQLLDSSLNNVKGNKYPWG